MTGVKGVALLDTDVASFMLRGVPLGAEYKELVRGYDLRLIRDQRGAALLGEQKQPGAT